MQSGSYRVRRAPDGSGKPEHIFVREEAGKWLPWASVISGPEQDVNQKLDGRRAILSWLWDKVRSSVVL